MKRFILLLLMVGSSHLALGAISADQVVDKVQQNATTDQPLRVEFQQVFEWKLTGKTETIDGQMLLEGLDKFRITTPDQTVVSNGKTMWTYSRVENQVLVDNVHKDAQSLMPRDILFSYKNDYTATITQQNTEVNGKPALVLRLVPKDQDQYFQETKVWVNTNSWEPLQVQFVDINNNETTYVINSIQQDQTINDTAFQFEPEAGTDVIDVR